ncbi:unnamed protein product [Rhizopus stolonifer]
MPTATIIKTSYSISNGMIVSFEKQDQKTLYIVQVEPEQGKSYKISKKYEEFIQFSQKLHEQFNKYSSDLPPKIKYKLHLLVTNKQIHAQRAEELNQFLCSLFSASPFIAQSYIVREFFQPQVYAESHTSYWKRLRSTSFLSRHTQPPFSSLCTQAANKLWHRQPEPSTSTPTTTMPRLKKSQSSLCLIKDTIKIKVIYDADNIIVIQVPRSIGLYELRSRILQKFSDSVTLIKSDWILLFHESTSSICSTSSFYLAQEKPLLPATVISKEDDLISLMNTKWSQLDKITLRCVM